MKNLEKVIIVALLILVIVLLMMLLNGYNFFLLFNLIISFTLSIAYMIDQEDELPLRVHISAIVYILTVIILLTQIK